MHACVCAGPGTVLDWMLGRAMAASRGTFDGGDTALAASLWPAGVSSDPYGDSLFGESDPLLSGLMSRAPASPGAGADERGTAPGGGAGAGGAGAVGAGSGAGAGAGAGAGGGGDKAALALQHTGSYSTLPTLSRWQLPLWLPLRCAGRGWHCWECAQVP